MDSYKPKAVWCWALICASVACSQRNDAAGAAAAVDASATSAPDAAGASELVASEPEPSCVEPESGLPSDVFCIGLYMGRDATHPRPDVMPYTPGVTLWSDGAQKQRYLYLPPGTTIDTSDMDAWSFPVGTKAFKEFRLEGALVETRIQWKRDGKNWEAGTYVWNEDQSAATLNTSRRPLILDSGYEIPTAKDCGRCHHGGADKLLGVEAVALALPTAEGLTLSELGARSLLSDAPAQTLIELPHDSSGMAGPALGYLHVNCGMPCHSGRGLGHETELLMRLRADEFWSKGAVVTPEAADTESYKDTVGEPALTGAVLSAFPGDLRITPGDHESSLVWVLAHRRGEYQMPPLVTHQVDEAGMQRLADWIDSLPAQ